MSDMRTIIEPIDGVAIPVIDLGPYLSGDPAAIETTARVLGDACETIGFFFIRNHGVDKKIIDRALLECERFHCLPLERKLAVKAVGKIVGYLPLSGQTQRTSVYGKSVAPERSASFYIRQESPADHPDRIANEPWLFDNRWPEDLPGFSLLRLQC